MDSLDVTRCRVDCWYLQEGFSIYPRTAPTILADSVPHLVSSHTLDLIIKCGISQNDSLRLQKLIQGNLCSGGKLELAALV